MSQGQANQKPWQPSTAIQRNNPNSKSHHRKEERMLTLNQSNSFMPGVYIHQATIIGAEDMSGKPTYADLPESIRDLAVEVEFDIGKEWTKKVIFKGNLKLVDPKNPKSIDWGGAFVVRDFFTKTGCFNNLTKEEIAEKLKSFSHKDIPADFMVKDQKQTGISARLCERCCR